MSRVCLRFSLLSHDSGYSQVHVATVGSWKPVAKGAPTSPPRAVHARGHHLGDHFAIGSVLCPFGDRVREIFSNDAVEGPAVFGPVELAEHVVEGPVLEEAGHHVVELVDSSWVAIR